MIHLSPTRTIIRGDSDRFKLSFVKKAKPKRSNFVYSLRHATDEPEAGIPIDITGWKIRFTVRPEVPDFSVTNDDDALISEEALILNGEDGKAEIYVQSENTSALTPGTYLYDIQVIKPADEYGRHQVSSIRRGKYVVLGDITRDELYTKNTDEIEIIHNEITDNITFTNITAGISNEKAMLTDTRVISDLDGHIVLELVKVTQKLDTEDEVKERESDDDADDGYDI